MAVYCAVGSDGKRGQANYEHEQKHATCDQNASVSYEMSQIHPIALSILTSMNTARFNDSIVRLHVNREKLNAWIFM